MATDPTEEVSPPSFEALYDAHFEFIYRCVLRLGVDASWAEDVTQDVFVIAHRKLSSFEGRSQPRTWLYGIARRVVRDHRRSKHQKRRGVPLETMELVSAEEPDAEVLRREAGRIVLALLERLDETKREVFVLSELEQMSGPEIAEAMGANLATTYTRIRAAREAFAEALAALRAEGSEA